MPNQLVNFLFPLDDRAGGIQNNIRHQRDDGRNIHCDDRCFSNVMSSDDFDPKEEDSLTMINCRNIGLTDIRGGGDQGRHR